MGVMNIEDPAKETAPRHALLQLSFRPFFLLGALAAIGLVACWLGIYGSKSAVRYYTSAAVWHGHEMIFGYTVAVIAGFLLTAARNWTDIMTARGAGLGLLVLLWLAGRVAPWLPGAPGAVVAMLDLAFLPVAAIVLAVPLLRAGKASNIMFVPLLLMLTVANALVHAEALGAASGLATTGLYLGLDMVVLLIVVMGGRVIPFFTERGVGNLNLPRYAMLDRVIITATGALVLAELAGWSVAVGITALVAGIANGMRVVQWYSGRIWRVPLVWVLHTGYAWLAAGLLLRAVASAGGVTPSIAIHALTAGAIGVLTLGMMARVALGHTGRPLAVGRWMVSAFVLANIAALVRVGVPLLVPAWYGAAVQLSGGIWIAAFTIFLATYTPILIRPRIDGRPG